MIELKNGFSFQSYQFKEEDFHANHAWNIIYQECLVPTPQCSICNEVISDLSDWMAFICPCQKQYHKNCLHEKIQNFNCPVCRESNKVFSQSNFLHKYQKTEEDYSKMYQLLVDTNVDHNQIIGLSRFIEGMKGFPRNLSNSKLSISGSDLELKIHSFWWGHMTAAPLLNVHKFLKPYNPLEAIRYMNDMLNSNPNTNMNTNPNTIITYDPCYVMDETSISFDKKKATYIDTVVFHQMDKFKQRLEEYSYQLIDVEFPFKEGEIVIYGEAVHRCLDSRVQLENIPKYCGIDVLICHPNMTLLTRNIKKVFKYFQDRFGNDIYWVKKSFNEILLLFGGYSRSVTLWFCQNTLQETMRQIDFSHLHFAYDGTQILTTLEGVEYSRYLISLFLLVDARKYREKLQRAKDSELLIIVPFVGIRNTFPRELIITSWYPLYHENLGQAHAEIFQHYGVKHRSISRGTPPRIMFSKISHTLLESQSVSRFF